MERPEAKDKTKAKAYIYVTGKRAASCLDSTIATIGTGVQCHSDTGRIPPGLKLLHWDAEPEENVQTTFEALPKKLASVLPRGAH